MSSPRRVEVFADPGLCSEILAKVVSRLDFEQSHADYQLVHQDRLIPLRKDNSLDLDAIRGWSRDGESDYTVILTEIPRRADHRPKVSAIHYRDGLVVISLPAMGVMNMDGKLQKVIFESLDALSYGEPSNESREAIHFGRVYEQDSYTGPSVFVTSPWWWPGRVRLVLGMVRTNQPFKDVSKLKGMWAAAAGTGAFGIFYSSIWQMAHALPSWRLAVISVLAVMMMVTWLMLSNRLWEPSHRLGGKVEAAMYNASTVATLLIAVVCMYGVLYVSFLATGLIVIETGFMAQTMKMPVDFLNYAEIAWLSSSMGLIAGAVGSNFDSTSDIHNLTHGQREQERHVDPSRKGSATSA